MPPSGAALLRSRAARRAAVTVAVTLAYPRSAPSAGASPPFLPYRVSRAPAALALLELLRLTGPTGAALMWDPLPAVALRAAAPFVHRRLPTATPPVLPLASGVRVPDPGFNPTSIGIIALSSSVAFLARRGAGLFAAEFLVPIRLPQSPTPSSTMGCLELATMASASFTAAPFLMSAWMIGMVTICSRTFMSYARARFRGHAGVSDVVIPANSGAKASALPLVESAIVFEKFGMVCVAGFLFAASSAGTHTMAWRLTTCVSSSLLPSRLRHTQVGNAATTRWKDGESKGAGWKGAVLGRGGRGWDGLHRTHSPPGHLQQHSLVSHHLHRHSHSRTLPSRHRTAHARPRSRLRVWVRVRLLGRSSGGRRSTRLGGGSRGV